MNKPWCGKSRRRLEGKKTGGENQRYGHRQRKKECRLSLAARSKDSRNPHHGRKKKPKKRKEGSKGVERKTWCATGGGKTSEGKSSRNLTETQGLRLTIVGHRTWEKTVEGIRQEAWKRGRGTERKEKLRSHSELLSLQQFEESISIIKEKGPENKRTIKAKKPKKEKNLE